MNGTNLKQLTDKELLQLFNDEKINTRRDENFINNIVKELKYRGFKLKT